MTREIEAVRMRLKDLIQSTGKQRKTGLNKLIAKEANLNPGTVSRFRRGVYLGDNAAVAKQLGRVLANFEAANAICRGDWKAAWLVKQGNRLRIIGKRDTLARLRDQDPDLHVVQIWIGPGATDLHFTSWEESE